MKTELVDKPVHFFAITFLFAWICGFIAAYFSYQDDMQTMLVLFIIPVVFSPSIAALIMLSGANNHALRKDFWARLSLGKIKLRYLPAILLIMPFALFLATALSLLFGQSVDQFRLSSEFATIGGQTVLTLVILLLAPPLKKWAGAATVWIASEADSISSRLPCSLGCSGGSGMCHCFSSMGTISMISGIPALCTSSIFLPRFWLRPY